VAALLGFMFVASAPTTPTAITRRRRTPLRLPHRSWATGGLIVGALIGDPKNLFLARADVACAEEHG